MIIKALVLKKFFSELLQNKIAFFKFHESKFNLNFTNF